jgi:hypothetical protein
MRWIQAGVLILASALLAGCGTVIRSEVTAFHEWPARLPQNTYVFERSAEQDASLEYRSYENLVRDELNRLGLVEAPVNVTPYLKTRFQYDVQARDVREVYPVVINPHWYGTAGWGMRSRFHSPFYGPYYGPFYGPFHDPFYDPFWYGPRVVQQREATYQVFTRRLHIAIARYADERRLYEATVVNEGREGALASVMPYLVRSAFVDFPGRSGLTRRVELRRD